MRIHIVCQRSLPNAYADDEQKEDGDKNDAKGIDSLDVGRVPREDHDQDNHQKKQTGVWKSELRPISFNLDSCITFCGKQKYRVQALWENLKVEDQGNVEVENEAAHGNCPSVGWKDSVHRVSKVSILPSHTKHQVVSRKAEEAGQGCQDYPKQHATLLEGPRQSDIADANHRIPSIEDNHQWASLLLV